MIFRADTKIFATYLYADLFRISGKTMIVKAYMNRHIPAHCNSLSRYWSKLNK
jgi:hypothetical protein